MKNSQISVSGAIVFKDTRGKKEFLVVKQGDEDKWQLPKITVRRGESSVRASLRMIGEMAGMNARILEEAGRGTGSAVINGKSVPQKYYYYLMVQISAGEVLGFLDHKWAPLAKARGMLELKREKDAMSNAKEVLREWEKIHKNQY